MGILVCSSAKFIASFDLLKTSPLPLRRRCLSHRDDGGEEEGAASGGDLGRERARAQERQETLQEAAGRRLT